MSFERQVSRDRRGRIFVDSMFLEFESEQDTFLALAAKYLNCSLILDPTSIGAPKFVVDIQPASGPSYKTLPDKHST